MRLFDVSEFSAPSNGETLATAAIQKAIDLCSASGGGEVFFPPGGYLTGSLFLKDGVTLHLAGGARLLASTRAGDYPANVHKQTHIGESRMDRCLIFAHAARDVGIIGRGVIDGQGTEFSARGEAAGFSPMLVRLLDCENILLRDVTLRSPASAAVAILYGRGICAQNVRIQSRAADRGDGMIFDGCRDVRISDCSVNAGDSAIVIECSRTDRPSQNLAITNCLLSGRTSAVRIGLLSAGMIENIAVSNCIVRDIEDVALRLHVCEGGILQNVSFANLVLREVARLAFISLNRHRAGVDAPVGMPPLGALRHVTINGVQAYTIHASDRRPAIVILGEREAKIENITLQNINAVIPGGGEAWNGASVRELGVSRPEMRALGSSFPTHGIYARHVRGLNVSDVRFICDNPDPRPSQAFEDVAESA